MIEMTRSSSPTSSFSRTRGEGDGEKTKILAEAYTKDEEFFRFYKSMSAYTEGLSSKNTTMVLTPDSDFFKYFNTLPSSAAGD